MLGSSVFAGKSKHIHNTDALTMTSSAGTVHQGNCQTNWRGRPSAGKPSIGELERWLCRRFRCNDSLQSGNFQRRPI